MVAVAHEESPAANDLDSGSCRSSYAELASLVAEITEREPAALPDLLEFARDLAAGAAARDDVLAAWDDLGRRIFARSRVHLALAIDAVETAVVVENEIDGTEEDQIVEWALGLAREAIARGGYEAAYAIWHVIVADWYRGTSSSRSPAMRRCDSPFEKSEYAEWYRELAVVVEQYARLVVASADEFDVRALRELVRCSDEDLGEYAPFCNPARSDQNPHEILEGTVCSLVYGLSSRRATRNATVAEVVQQFAYGTSMMQADHELTGTWRLGLIAWLARCGLQKSRPSAKEAKQP